MTWRLLHVSGDFNCLSILPPQHFYSKQSLLIYICTGIPQSGPGDVQVQWKGEMPDSDVDDNESAPSQPTAPPMEQMDAVQGYNNIGFDGMVAPPPSYDDVVREPPQREQLQRYSSIV